MNRALRAVTVIVAAGLAWAVQACAEPSSCPLGIGIDIQQFVTDGYNTAVKGTGGGSGLNISWSCPGGGSATITGTANTQAVTFDLTFAFHACVDSTLGDLTLDGTLEDQTTNGANSATETETAHSDALKINGTESLCKADPIDATCVVDITATTTTICGLSSD